LWSFLVGLNAEIYSLIGTDEGGLIIMHR
jgi:hypothetical protein